MLKKITLSYINNLLQILLVTHSSLSTYIFNYIIFYNVTDLNILIISIIYIIFFIGFPIFVIYKLENNCLLLKIDYFIHKYNCLYYIYNYNNYRFIYYIFLKIFCMHLQYM